jgi:hypothetical protein
LLGATSGAFFEDCSAVRIDGDHHLRDADMASRLWQLSESLLGDYLVRHQQPDPSELEGWRRR